MDEKRRAKAFVRLCNPASSTSPPFRPFSIAMFSTLLPKLFGYFFASLTDKHVPLRIGASFACPFHAVLVNGKEY